MPLNFWGWGLRLVLTSSQGMEASDGGAHSELPVPEVGLPFFNCCRPQALTPPLRTTGTDTPLPQKSCLYGQCHAMGVREMGRGGLVSAVGRLGTHWAVPDAQSLS